MTETGSRKQGDDQKQGYMESSQEKTYPHGRRFESRHCRAKMPDGHDTHGQAAPEDWLGYVATTEATEGSGQDHVDDRIYG